jgi:hypothetical protein
MNEEHLHELARLFMYQFNREIESLDEYLSKYIII